MGQRLGELFHIIRVVNFVLSFQDGPKWHKISSYDPKMAEYDRKYARDETKRVQDAPKRGQNGSKMRKRVQDAPKMSQNAVKMGQNAIKINPRNIKGGEKTKKTRTGGSTVDFGFFLDPKREPKSVQNGLLDDKKQA